MLISAIVLALVGFRTPNVAPARHKAARAGQTGYGVDFARREVYPALVNVRVVVRFYTGGRSQRQPAGGSGVIVSPLGYILTNYHVAGHTTRLICTLTDGESLDADVVAHDTATDISVLKLRLAARPPGAGPVPFARLGDSAGLTIGQPVLAMGNPLMLSSSLTQGVVSNTHRVFTDFNATQMEDVQLDDDERTGMFTRWIQHDALILPGNSGGPLVDLHGHVVGINELGGNGVGFAIPSNTAANVLHQVLASGSVQRGWLGISVYPVDRLGMRTGALISSVQPGSPAATAHIMPGDILTSMNSTPIAVRFFEQVPLLYQSIADLKPGLRIRLTLLRKGSPVSAAVTVARMEPMQGHETEMRKGGITVRTITTFMAITQKLPFHGLLVTGVRTGYPFDQASPRVSDGDVITQVGSTPVNSPAQLEAALAKLGPSPLRVEFVREDEHMVTAVKTVPTESDDQSSELPKAWIGILTQVVTPDTATALGIPGTTGFRVTEVYPDTAASKGGVQTGDIITSINGEPLKASRSQDEGDLKRAVEDLTVGEKASLGVLRGSQNSTLSVTLEAAPTSAPQAKKNTQDELEFSVREITRMDRIQHRWSQSQTGVLVTLVTPGGYAAMAGLHPDDVILSVAGSAIDTIDRFKSVITPMVKRHARLFEIMVLRDAETRIVIIEPDWSHSAGKSIPGGD